MPDHQGCGDGARLLQRRAAPPHQGRRHHRGQAPLPCPPSARRAPVSTRGGPRSARAAAQPDAVLSARLQPWERPAAELRPVPFQAWTCCASSTSPPPQRWRTAWTSAPGRALRARRSWCSTWAAARSMCRCSRSRRASSRRAARPRRRAVVLPPWLLRWPQTVQVLATSGDTHLGGEDFDSVLSDWVQARISRGTRRMGCFQFSLGGCRGG